MAEATPHAALKGQRVQVAARPDWGVGIVLKVLSTTIGDAPQHRVTVQFAHGTRTLLVPPAVLSAPSDQPEKPQGWIDALGKDSLDHRLRQVDDEALRVLGGIRTRLAAVYPLYEFTDDPKSISLWARKQTGVGDPLSRWSRDELALAFTAFCNDRDAHLRNLAALLVNAEGREALESELISLEPEVAERVRSALRRVV